MKSNWLDALEKTMLKVRTNYVGETYSEVFISPNHITRVTPVEHGTHIITLDGSVYWTDLPAEEFAALVRARCRERA